MSVLRFSSKADLIEALEARRPWAERLDAEHLAKHQKDEQAHLRRFREACREAARWDYATAKTHSFKAGVVNDRGFSVYPPDCPRSLVASLDQQLNIVRATRQERFQISPEGVWSRVHHLLTHDETITAEMC